MFFGSGSSVQNRFWLSSLFARSRFLRLFGIASYGSSSSWCRNSVHLSFFFSPQKINQEAEKVMSFVAPLAPTPSILQHGDKEGARLNKPLNCHPSWLHNKMHMKPELKPCQKSSNSFFYSQSSLIKFIKIVHIKTIYNIYLVS